MRYVASVIINDVEEAASVIKMFDAYERETTFIDRASTCVVACSHGHIAIDLDLAPIFTVH